MTRAQSDSKREAILAAAIRVIAAQGLGAPTAAIAKEAGVANGSLFNYFPTKAVLLNQLYIALKEETAAAALQGIPPKAAIREQALHMWSNSLRWAMSAADKRRTLAHLRVCNDITPANIAAGHKIMAGVAAMIERGRAGGPMKNTPLPFVIGILNALTDATVEFMLQDPANADAHGIAGFEALWRAIG